MSNKNSEALAEYVERLVNLETEVIAAKDLLKESKKDMKAEVKATYDKTGVEWETVVKGAKARLAKKSIAERRAELDEEDALLDLLNGVEDPMG